MQTGVRGVVATAIVCMVATALPVAAGAATSPKCSSDQIDIGGTCTSKEDVSKQIVSITQGVMRQEDAKGVVLRVDVGNDTVVNTGLGLSQEGVPVTPDMKWRPGSMAIPMLTSIELQLQEQGKLSLDDTLSKWYPQYPNADKVTLRMLSSVTSGYPDFIQENPPFQAAQLAEPFRHWTDDELLQYAFALPVVCDPGACFHYAHTNFILLGNVLQKVTGKSVTELIQQKFLGPLGMTQTKITKLPAIPAPALHAYTDERGVYEESTGWSPSWGLGDGLIMTSTARDMTTLIKAIGTGKFLSKKSVSEQFEDLSKGLEGAPTAIGYGLGIAVAGKNWVLQNPVFNGYAGIAAYERGQKISIVIDNTHGPNAAAGTSIASEIYKALANYLAPKDPI
ncbi:MAG TPA: serine hydrolase domain-containing protein [Acidimicrobiia bacterium]|nr:serine hydrolase domain-containing protein [Acidimicrobiia bacterium]